MDNKIKSILVLSVLFVVLVGTTALSANETSTDTTGTEDDLISISVSPTEDNDVTSNESQPTEDVTPEEETETNLTTKDTQNTTTSSGTLMEGYSNDETLEIMAYFISLATDSEINELGNALNIMDSEKYARLSAMLLNRDKYSEYAFYDALKDLDYASQKEILNVMQAIDEDSNNNLLTPSKNKVSYKNVKTSTDNVKSSSNDVITSAINTVKSYVSPVKAPVNKETIVTPNTADDKYDVYMYYLALYVEGKLTYDEFINALDQAGFDTSKITLNEDGSVTYNGQTSDVPINAADDNIELYNHNLALYEEGRLTYDEFVNVLSQSGFDTSKITLNDDGSVTYNGQTSDVPINTADNTANDATSDSTDENTDNTDTTDSTDVSADTDSTSQDTAGRTFGGR